MLKKLVHNNKRFFFQMETLSRSPSTIVTRKNLLGHAFLSPAFPQAENNTLFSIVHHMNYGFCKTLAALERKVFSKHIRNLCLCEKMYN